MYQSTAADRREARIERLLIVSPGWLGDVILTHSLLQHLKKERLRRCIDVLSMPAFVPIFSRMPEVRRVIPAPVTHGKLDLKARYRMGRRLRTEGYSQAIILSNSYKSALIPYWAHITRRTGWLGEQRYGIINDIRPNLKNHARLADKFVALGLAKNEDLSSPIDWPILLPNTNNLSTVLSEHGLTIMQGSPLLVLCPGARFGGAKQWWPEHFASVANAYLKIGWQVWLMGSAEDRGMASRMTGLTQGRAFNLAGKTTLDEAIDFMSLADLVISNDSGLMHMAAALDRPLIAIYGSSSTTYTPPLAKQAVSLYSAINCRPCFQRECPFKHRQCMSDITPDEVLSRAKLLLESQHV